MSLADSETVAEGVVDPATVVDALFADLDGVIAALTALDVDVCGDELLDRLAVGLLRGEDMLHAAGSSVVACWRAREAWRVRKAPNAGVGLATAAGRSDTSARVRLSHADKLIQLPLVHQAVLEGRLSLEYAQLLLRAATPERMALAVRDQELLIDQLGRQRTYRGAAAVVAYWVQRADDEVGVAPAPELRSSLYWSRSEIAGESHMHGTFSAVDTEIIEAELRRRIAQIRRRDRADGHPRRPMTVLRAQALVEMAARSINAHGATARPLFQIIVGDDTASHLCQLASGHVIHPSHLARWLDTAAMETFLFDGPSTIISKSHLRTFTGALRKAIQVRDRRCQHTSGCSTPAVDCDVDHIVAWAQGGVTSQFNGHSKCDSQNRKADLRDNPTPQPERTITPDDQTTAIDTWRTRHRRNNPNPDNNSDEGDDASSD